MNRSVRISLSAAAVALAAGAVIVPSALATPEDGTPTRSTSRLSAQELRNQKAAVALLDQAFNQHRPGKAAEKYISADTYIQHNPNFGNGRDAFVNGVTGYLQQFPDASLTFKRTVTQGDLVVVQGLAKTSAEDRGTVEVDTFRFDRHGRIVEHWDALQPVAEKSANGNPQV